MKKYKYIISAAVPVLLLAFAVTWGLVNHNVPVQMPRVEVGVAWMQAIIRDDQRAVDLLLCDDLDNSSLDEQLQKSQHILDDVSRITLWDATTLNEGFGNNHTVSFFVHPGNGDKEEFAVVILDAYSLCVEGFFLGDTTFWPQSLPQPGE